MSIDKLFVKANEMVAEGAWALDVGGMSSRPGASIISHEEEWSRVNDVLSELQSLREGFDLAWIRFVCFYRGKGARPTAGCRYHQRHQWGSLLQMMLCIR